MATHRNEKRAAKSAEVRDDEATSSNTERESTRVSRWTSLLYLVVALAAPVLVYSGPDVLSPSAPAIADAALDGRFTIHRHAKCNTTNRAGAKSETAARDDC